MHSPCEDHAKTVKYRGEVSHTDNMDGVCRFGTRDPDQEIIRFNVAIDQRFVVDRLHASNLDKRKNGRKS